ncbi:response regulator [Pseudomonas syringae]|nr:response regulator [Pseudomonas syringae]MBD8791052.1 response regulator [Pseudomonas syringae]MBD8801811.1 response regulator [Pseudomonas syringae]MBD8811839.1 response regulator [Pseudomonas syringae]
MFKHNLRILLVEDHPFQLIATQILLNNQGYYLLTPALTAAEAFAALERSPEPYDLLLCDQCLPDIGGLEVIDHAWRKGLARQAILLSGLNTEQLQGLEQSARQRGLPLLGCLSKPLHGPDLLHLLNAPAAENHVDCEPDPQVGN